MVLQLFVTEVVLLLRWWCRGLILYEYEYLPHRCDLRKGMKFEAFSFGW
jgi:hypothetical protein